MAKMFGRGFESRQLHNSKSIKSPQIQWFAGFFVLKTYQKTSKKLNSLVTHSVTQQKFKSGNRISLKPLLDKGLRNGHLVLES